MTPADVAEVSGDLSLQMFYMLHNDLPSAGTYNAVASFSGAATDISIYCRSVSGVGQGGPFNVESKSGTGSSLTSDSFTASANSVIFKMAAFDDDTLTCDSHGASETEVNETDQDSGSESCATTKLGAGGSTTTATTLSGSATTIVAANLVLPAAATDTTAPTVSSVSLSCTGGTCFGSAETDEHNGTMSFWLTTTPTATYAQCQANAQYTSSVTTSPVTKGGLAVLTSDTYYLHACHEDAAGNGDSVGTSEAAVVVIDTDCPAGTAQIKPFFRSQLCAPLR
jgi:hypothetical protein